MFVLPPINEDENTRSNGVRFDFTKYRRHSSDTNEQIIHVKRRSESELLPKAPPSILRNSSKTSLSGDTNYYRVKFKENKLPELSRHQDSIKKSLTEVPLKHGGVELFTTKARLAKSSLSSSSSHQQQQQQKMSKLEIMKPLWESIRDNFFRKQYEAKTEDLKRVATQVEHSIKQKQTLLRNKHPLRRQKSKNEVVQLIDEIKRLHINDSETPLPSDLKQKPDIPRLFSQLSIEGQYALMKTYEDTIFNELYALRPDLASFMQRVHTSKFKLRPKRKQNSFILPSKPEDPHYLDHQLSVSHQLEIAQEIMDFIKRAKGDFVTCAELNEELDILKTYASFCKIWSKYFHLR